MARHKRRLIIGSVYNRRLFLSVVFIGATVTLVTVIALIGFEPPWVHSRAGGLDLRNGPRHSRAIETLFVGASEPVNDTPDMQAALKLKHDRIEYTESKKGKEHVLSHASVVHKQNPDNHKPSETFSNILLDHGESETSTKSSPLVTTLALPTLASFHPSKELFVRAVYFDDRPRDRHKNSSVFLVVAKKQITDKKLIVGCQVGSHVARNFKTKLIGETSFWRNWNKKKALNNINHEEVLVDCYDLPVVNGSMGYIRYKTSKDSKIEIAASERPLMFPSPRVPPTTEEGKKYNMSIVTCAKVFNHPPWMKEWLQYQRTIGVDHVHLDAEDTFVQSGESKQPHITNAVNEGYLSIDIWNKYLNSSEIWYHNQGLIFEDCAYRFRGTYDYMVLVDTDDFFTPRTPGEPTLHYYIDKYCRDKRTGSCKFKWINFYPDHYHLTNASDADGNVTRRLASYSHVIDYNPKSIHRGNVVVDAATHYAHKMISGYGTREVSLKQAYFAHVRRGRKVPKVEDGLRVGIP